MNRPRLNPRLKKVFFRLSIAFTVLTVILAGVLWFLASTQSGTEWLFTQLGAFIPGKLEVASLTGPIRGPLDIRGLHYEREGMEVFVDRVQLDWRLGELLERRLDIHKLYADNIRVITTPSEEEKERTPLPDVNLRFNIIVRDARVRGLSLASKTPAPGETPFVIDSIDLKTTAIQNDVRVDSLTVRSPTLDADVKGSVRPQGDYPVDLDVRWAYRAPDTAPFAGGGKVSGTLVEMNLVQEVQKPFPVSLKATLLDPLYELRFDARAAFSGLNPRLIQATLPDLPASGEVTAKGNLEAFTSQGIVSGVVEEVGSVRVDYDLTRDGDTWRIQKAEIELPGTPARLAANGTVTLRGEDMDLDAEASWTNAAWPLRGGAPVVSSRSGQARISGSLDDYRAEVKADVRSPSLPPETAGTWIVAGTGDRTRFRFENLQGTAFAGSIQARGDVTWDPVIKWNAAIRGQGIDPGRISKDFPGRLSFAATSRGQLADAGPVGTVQLSRLEGTVRNQPVLGSADVQLAGSQYQISKLDLTWSDARLGASGSVGDQLDLDWNLSAPNLGIAVPQGGGSVVAQGHLSGPMKTPRIEADATGEGLRFGTTAVGKATVVADVDLSPNGLVSLDVQSTGVISGENRVDELSVQGRGRRSSHQVDLAARNEQGTLSLALAGGLTGESLSNTAWRGQIRRLDLRSEPVGNWSLGQPAELAASTEAVDLQDFCWVSGSARLCADGGWAKAGTWNVDSTVADFPLNRFKPFLPPDLEITGDLNGTVQARGNGAALASANVDLRPGPGELRFPGKEGEALTFKYADGIVKVQAGAGGQGTATANLTLVDVGTIAAQMEIPRLAGGTAAGAKIQEQPLAGRIDVNLANLAFLEGFLPDINNLAGTLKGGYQLSGTVGSPRFVGQATLANGRANVPQLGLELRDMKLSAVGDGTGVLAIDGSVRSGKGTLKLQGRAGVPNPETPIRLAITGRDIQAMKTEEISVLVSPDLNVVYDGKLIRMTGDVQVPSADIEMTKREKGPIAASEDVVFVNESQDALPEKSMALSAQVRITLGKDVDIDVFGLKGKPTGSVLAIEEPGRVTRGTGELVINEGTFKAYGQDLKLERARVIFAGPLANPRLDVRAYRTAKDGTVAGINAKGTLESPEVTLWSEPAMAQGDALAYLLLGRSLNQTSPEEGDQLANAATSLGLKGGNLLAKKLAARFGLEEARIETDGSLDEAALVVGKYLSPRLYVSYGIGLFEPINTFRVRYLLSDKWTLQAESGEGTSADALYTVERGKPKPKKPATGSAGSGSR